MVSTARECTTRSDAWLFPLLWQLPRCSAGSFGQTDKNAARPEVPRVQQSRSRQSARAPLDDRSAKDTKSSDLVSFVNFRNDCWQNASERLRRRARCRPQTCSAAVRRAAYSRAGTPHEPPARGTVHQRTTVLSSGRDQGRTYNPRPRSTTTTRNHQ